MQETESKDVIRATAAYAAALVVFVGDEHADPSTSKPTEKSDVILQTDWIREEGKYQQLDRDRSSIA
jgi:hypothetical protein